MRASKNSLEERISFLICGSLLDIIQLLVHPLIWSDWRFYHASTFHSWTITGSVCSIWPARGCTPDYSSSFLTSCFCLASFRKFPLITKSNTLVVLFYLPRSLEKVKQYAYVKNSCLHSSYLLHFAFRIWVPFKWPRT